MDSLDPALTPFFNPQGIAIIGASTDEGKLGYHIARNLVEIGYSGVVHFVNPRGGYLFGRPFYSDLAHTPEPVDLAVVLIPAAAIPQALIDCGERGIQAVIIVSSGFRETGTDGARLEGKLIEIARHYGIRIIGPNCIGLVDTHLPIDTTFLKPPPPPKGNIAFISHSGATCAAVIDWSRGQGFGFSRLVSLGNQIDINETDMLHFMADDPATHSLALYLESISDGRRFIDIARNVARNKPIVVLKSGKYASGQRAAASHTGALAGQDNAFEAAFKRAGIIRANTLEELFEWAYTLASCPLPEGRSMAVLTSAGGLGVAAADALEANGLNLAELTENTRNALQAVLPAAASTLNPVDMLASATPEQYSNCLEILLADPNVNGILVIILPPPVTTEKTVAETILPVIKSSHKPIISALVGESLIQNDLVVFQKAQIPEFRFPERAAAALSALVKRENIVSNDLKSITTEFAVDRQSVRTSLADNRPGKFESILNAYGIPALPLHLARSREEVEIIAEQLGFPVVLKIISPDLTHKSDFGGVLFNIADVKSAKDGFDHLIKQVQFTNPAANIQGVAIQPMIPEGQEVIIGGFQDKAFGPLVMFGSGGIEVEGLQDVAFALAPLTHKEAEDMLNSTWAGRKLHGYRSIAPADHEAVLDALLRLAQLVSDFPDIGEIEINPLRVLPTGKGVISLDVRGTLA